MVRPRLVQEGAPIFGPGSEGNVNLVGDEAMMQAASPADTAARPPSTLSAASPKSSLQQALASTSNTSSGWKQKWKKTNKSITSSFVVGGRRKEEANSEQVIPNGSRNRTQYQNQQHHHYHHDYQQQQKIPPQHHPNAAKSLTHSSSLGMASSAGNNRATTWPGCSATSTTQDSSCTIGTNIDAKKATFFQSQAQEHINNIPSPMDEDDEHHTAHVYHANQPTAAFQSHIPAPQSYQLNNTLTVQQHGAINSSHDSQQQQHQPQQYSKQQTRCEIGANTDANHPSLSSSPPEKMTGVEDQGEKTPLVVLDGANVAHYYAQAKTGISDSRGKTTKPEPDVTGIQVVQEFFVQVGIRVLVVLPQYWFRRKPRPGETKSSWNVAETDQVEILNKLREDGFIVASPPADDDDAYALTIARREEGRSLRRNGEGPGFVLSNDMFRDAQNRDPTGVLEQWLRHGRHESVGPGRISYAFCDMGTLNDHGEPTLDFVPNPRHPLVAWVEGLQQSGGRITT